MKKAAFLIAMTLVFSSCSWLNDDPVEETQTTVVEVENQVETPNTDGEEDEVSTEETIPQPVPVEDTMEESSTDAPDTAEVDASSETSITEELANGTEDEQLLNEVFNEINEVFELVEQNGGQ